MPAPSPARPAAATLHLVFRLDVAEQIVAEHYADGPDAVIAALRKAAMPIPEPSGWKAAALRLLSDVGTPMKTEAIRLSLVRAGVRLPDYKGFQRGILRLAHEGHIRIHTHGGAGRSYLFIAY